MKEEWKENQNHLKTGGESLEFKNNHNLASNLTMNEDCKKYFQELKVRRKHRYIIFKMGEESFEVETLGLRAEVCLSSRQLI